MHISLDRFYIDPWDYNYINETHYVSIDFSQHASILCHYPLYVMSPSTRSYIYFFNRFFGLILCLCVDKNVRSIIYNVSF
jgi:hypothetical protein